MLNTTSPTVSAPPSPAAFLIRSSPYHAPRRTSSSSCVSPRLSSAPPRRPDARPAASHQSPAPSFARSPQLRRIRHPEERTYKDAATQWSPRGPYPLTYKPPTPTPAAAPSALPPQPAAPVQRRETSAEPTATEFPEPNLRTEPQAPPPAQSPQPARGVSRGREKIPQRILQTSRQNETSGVPSALSSPTKRARPRSSSLRIVPLKYETCDVKDLGVLISDMLMELVRLNDEMPLRDGQLTRFHSRAPPAISVKDYLFRLIVHATLSPPILLSMVYYVDKLCAMDEAFTVSSLTVHRFLITAGTVAAKGLSDSFWTNSLYAKVGGVSVRELALLELEFLQKLDWRIVPKPEALVDYYRALVERGEGYTMEKSAGLEASSTADNWSSSKADTLVASTIGPSES